MSRTLLPPDGVVSTTFAEGEVVLVHLGQNKYFKLNHSAGVLWGALSKGAGEEEAALALRRRFEVAEPRAAESCRNFVNQALSLGILVERA